MNPTFTWGSFGTKMNELKNNGITVFSMGIITLRGIENVRKGADGFAETVGETTSVISSGGEEELPELSPDD